MCSIFGCRLLSAVTSFPVIGKVVIMMFNDNFAPKQRLAESVNIYVHTGELSKEDILKILSTFPPATTIPASTNCSHMQHCQELCTLKHLRNITTKPHQHMLHTWTLSIHWTM